MSPAALLRALVVAAGLAALPAAAQTLDINLSDDSAQFKYAALVGGSIYGRSELSVGFLYHENGNTLSEVGLHVVDEAGSKTPGLILGVGPKLYYATTKKGDALAVGLGGRAQYKVPEVQRLVLAGYFYYAPGITSFMDADSLFEGGLAVEYELLPTANAYLGYRTIQTRMAVRGNAAVDRGLIAGLRFSF